MTEANIRPNMMMSLPSSKPKPDGGFKEFLYNSETGAVLGRTGLSWLLIFVFYVIFYIALSAFFLFNFYLFYLTLNMDTPKWTMEESLIGTTPGLGFRPMPDQDSNADSTLIWFKHNDPKDYKFWADQLKEFIERTENIQRNAGVDQIQSCGWYSDNTATKDKSCLIDLKQLGPCNKDNDFGYSSGQPCILIKLNKIIGWKPEAFGYRDARSNFNRDLFETDLSREQEEKGMPDDLAQFIRKEVATLDSPRDADLLRRYLGTVWISCVGENPGDMENIGEINYYPTRGIKSYYFPYLNQKGYQAPFIMAQFVNPVHGVLINVECRAFAKNLVNDRLARVGTAHFELLID